VLAGAKTFHDQRSKDFDPIAPHLDRYYAQKMPIFVRAGHSVTLSVPNSERGFALLYDPEHFGIAVDGGYRVEDGERAVRFSACPQSEPSFVRVSRRRTLDRVQRRPHRGRSGLSPCPCVSPARSMGPP
jgi:hypothetical protein